MLFAADISTNALALVNRIEKFVTESPEK